MRIETLTLRGFLRFRDALTLDLRDVPSGLVAITGPNGAGKTTVLEAAPAALYRSFLTRGDLIDYATGRDSYLEMTVALDGRGTYRARVNVDGATRKSNATLEAIAADGSARKMNDGQVGTYDQAVAAVFPSREVLLASAFAAQNKAGSFIAMDRKKRKDLFAALLGIERYQTMSETARQAAALVEQARATLQSQRTLIAIDASDAIAQGLATRGRELDAAVAQTTIDREACAADVARLEAEVAQSGDAVALMASARARLAQVTATLGGLVRDAEANAAAVRTAQEDHRRRLTAIDDRLARDRAALDADDKRRLERARADRAAAGTRRYDTLADVEKRRDGNRKILDMADRIRAAVARAAELTTAIEAADRRLDESDAPIERLDRDLAELDEAIRADRDRQTRLDAAARDAGLLRTVPCGGAGEYAGCQFLTNASAAAATIPGLEADLAGASLRLTRRQALAGEYQQLKDARAAAATAARGLRDEAKGLTALTQYASALEAATARLEELAAQAAEADRTYTDALASIDAALAEGDAASVRRREDLTVGAVGDTNDENDRFAGVMGDLEDRRVELARTVAKAKDDRDEAGAAVDAAESGNVAAMAVAAALRDARARWDGIVGTLASLEQARTYHARELDTFARNRAALEVIDARLAGLDTDLVEWQTLAKAFGRDGLSVLEIDAAGPTISAYTNEQLEVCFGPRFTVELATQQERAGGKGLKEDFSIRVTDNARDGEVRDIADLSGGEQVIVAEALSNAICIYVNTRAPQPVRTCWRDETTGALDPENAARYMLMLRKVQELGGFHHVLFISHNPDAAAQADAQIRLDEGRATVVLAPFEG